MVKCYFDNDSEVNLSYIDQVKNVRTLVELKEKLQHTELEFITSKEYNYPGLYIIEVSKHSYLWCSDHLTNGFNILDNLPSHVITAVLDKKIRLVIISVIEGDTFDLQIDCYKNLNESIQRLKFPNNSVLIVSGNLKASDRYKQWCDKNNQSELIEFVQGIEWFGKNYQKRTDPIFYSSIKNNKKLFNSLNRSHRNHRTDHLFFLANNNLLDKGLVSGGAMFDNITNLFPTFIDETTVNYQEVLNQHYPLSLDIDSSKMSESHLAGISNLQIFNDTLLTVSTETFFDDPGMFITEKTFRSIAMGHPFIILGQVGILKKLQSYGFRTDFIDTDYDEIADHKKRFAKFHESFLNWIHDDKEKYYNKWLDIVEHNLYIYKQLNFRKQYLDEIVSSTEKYFKESF